MEWVAWLSTVITAGLVIVVFIAKRGVLHKFNEKIETLRGEIRKSEEEFRSELRSKETQISALRDGVLSGRANRQALLDKRRLKAVEQVWTAINELSPYKTLSASMSVINFNAASQRTPQEPPLRKFFKTIGSNVPDVFPNDLAENERPFVSPIAWALFSAYKTIVAGAFGRAKILELGIKNAGKAFDTEHVKKLLKSTLPHRAEFIDQRDIEALYYLLDEIEEKLLFELMKTLEGVEADEAAITRSAKIMKVVDKIQAESVSQISENSELQAASSS